MGTNQGRKVLRDKPQSELNAHILVKVLNAIVKAVYRGQDVTRVYVVADAETKLVNYVAYSEKAEKACAYVETIVRSFGYRASHHLEFEKDFSGKVIMSAKGHIIFSVCILVEELQEMSMDTVSAVRGRWKELNAQLPHDPQKKPHKKKKK